MHSAALIACGVSTSSEVMYVLQFLLMPECCISAWLTLYLYLVPFHNSCLGAPTSNKMPYQCLVNAVCTPYFPLLPASAFRCCDSRQVHFPFLTLHTSDTIPMSCLYEAVSLLLDVPQVAAALRPAPKSCVQHVIVAVGVNAPFETTVTHA